MPIILLGFEYLITI